MLHPVRSEDESQPFTSKQPPTKQRRVARSSTVANTVPLQYMILVSHRSVRSQHRALIPYGASNLFRSTLLIYSVKLVCALMTLCDGVHRRHTNLAS